MAANFRWLLGLVALVALCLGVQADCVSYGVDYSNGGAYYIDGSSNQYFSFITVFQGRPQPALLSLLQGTAAHSAASAQAAPRRASAPSSRTRMATSMPARPSTRRRPAPRSPRPGKHSAPCGFSCLEPDSACAKTCPSGIPFSAMKSGVWKIVVSGDQIAVQRSITLTVGIPQTVTVIVRLHHLPVRWGAALLTRHTGNPNHRAGDHVDAEGEEYAPCPGSRARDAPLTAAQPPSRLFSRHRRSFSSPGP